MTLGLVISPPLAEVELAADALWTLGAVAVEERAVGAGVELWTSLGEDRAAIVAALPTTWPYRFEQMDDAVADTWRSFATPTQVSPTLVICPAWATYEPSAGERVISIEPGATFGLGDHPTTILSLQAVERLVQPGDMVLDVGCGSGVLAIAALLLGAERAVAIDINPASVQVTNENAARNEITCGLSVSTLPLVAIDGTYELVLANILAPALIELSDGLRRTLAPAGHLVISGILATNFDHVLAALRPLRVVETLVLDGWAAVILRWPSDD